MKLLVITQTVDLNDDVLGSFHVWLKELAKNCDSLLVICLRRGQFDLPANVKVLSLGKESGYSRLKYLKRFFKYLWQYRHDYDRVFVHMNPIYIILAGWWWRLSDKSVALWYTHRQVDLKLRIAAYFSNIIFTAAPESFRLKSKKIKVVGHGIDVESFKCGTPKSNQVFTILHIGRLTPIKNCDTLIIAAGFLKTILNQPFKVVFVGAAVTTSDQVYAGQLREQVKILGLEDIISFVGSVPNRLICDYYCQADLTVNLTPTGGIDKAVLESMAAGLPVLTSNQAFRDYFGIYADRLIFTLRDAKDLADKISTVIISDRAPIANYLQQVVKERSDVSSLINKIITLWL
ncbi:MAG: glycosyltransferase family 4 protein [Candidatus Vogelbacteria bacterium]|nr:glycosyltransferase family 4 protein [Candidatus Vogelbacteria bacterium]